MPRRRRSGRAARWTAGRARPKQRRCRQRKGGRRDLAELEHKRAQVQKEECRELLEVTPLPTASGPSNVEALRPIIVIPVEAKLQSQVTRVTAVVRRTSLHRRVSGPLYDGLQAWRLVSRTHLCGTRLVERSTEWRSLCALRTWTSPGRTTVSDSNAPWPIRAVYLRDLRGVDLTFRHQGWQTLGLTPTVRLHQGCRCFSDGSWRTCSGLSVLSGRSASAGSLSMGLS